MSKGIKALGNAESETDIFSGKLKNKFFRYVKIGGILVAIGAGGAGIYFLIKRLTNPQNTDNKEHKADIITNELSMTEAEFSELADRLFVELDSYDVNEDSVYAMLKTLKNKSDWNELFIKYDSKKSKSFIDWTEGNLTYWLQKKMADSDEQAEIKSILTAIGVSW